MESRRNKTLWAPGLDEEKANTAFPFGAIGKGLAGAGVRIAAASGEKNSTTGVPSLVAKETVSPLTIWTLAALGTKFPPLWMSVMSVCAM